MNAWKINHVWLSTAQRSGRFLLSPYQCFLYALLWRCHNRAGRQRLKRLIDVAKIYRQHEDVTQFWWWKTRWCSTRWMAAAHFTRGNILTPAWFVQIFLYSLVGDYGWASRYETLFQSSASQTHDGWKTSSHVFDLPAQGGPFTERVEVMRQLARRPIWKLSSSSFGFQ